MQAVELVFAIAWAAFWIYWLVAAFSMRGAMSWVRELRIRVLIVILVVILSASEVPGSRPQHRSLASPPRLALFALGLGFAIWARIHIGRNWGTPMSQKDEPELVTSGPYHLVRHPIYSGIPLQVPARL